MHYDDLIQRLRKGTKLPLLQALMNEAADAIAALTAADVRPVVRGKWMPSYDSTEYDFDGSTLLSEPHIFQDGWQCSLCGQYEPSEENYCPNCGADMKGES